MRKLGRNERCWCGSGIKYKKCHLNRESQDPRSIQDALDASRKAFTNSKCLAPGDDCTERVISSHTVPRSTSLKLIADQGHVYGFDTSLAGVFRAEGRVQPSRMGINRASTFTGFCNKHDTRIFEDIETKPLVLTPMQAMLLGYRCLTKEHFAKRGALRANEAMKEADRGKGLAAQQEIQLTAAAMERGGNAGLAELEEAKLQYDACLKSNDAARSHFHHIRLSNTPTVLVAGGTNPEYDFRGSPLQDVGDLSMPAMRINFAIVADGGGGHAVFEWLDDNPVAEKLVASLQTIDTEHLTEALVRFCFSSFENTFWSIPWWDALDDRTRRGILGLTEVAIDLTVPTDPAALIPTGLDVGNWGPER